MADSKKFQAHSAVFVALINKKGEVLLHRRANTGFMDGRYDLPSGHVEQDEPLLRAAARELKEEAGVSIKQSALKLWHINQHAANGQSYYNFYFIAKDWQGEPCINEPHKCDDMQFFPLTELPKLTSGSHMALKHIKSKAVLTSYTDQPTYDLIAQD